MGHRGDHDSHELGGRQTVLGVDTVDEHVGEVGDGGGVLEIVEWVVSVSRTYVHEIVGEMTWEKIGKG